MQMQWSVTSSQPKGTNGTNRWSVKKLVLHDELCEAARGYFDEFFAVSLNMRSYFFFRQIVARTILETLRVVTDDASDVEAVLNVMTKLADDVGKD